jgi:hypothetical protein
MLQGYDMGYYHWIDEEKYDEYAESNSQCIYEALRSGTCSEKYKSMVKLYFQSRQPVYRRNYSDFIKALYDISLEVKKKGFALVDS